MCGLFSRERSLRKPYYTFRMHLYVETMDEKRLADGALSKLTVPERSIVYLDIEE